MNPSDAAYTFQVEDKLAAALARADTLESNYLTAQANWELTLSRADKAEAELVALRERVGRATKTAAELMAIYDRVHTELEEGRRWSDINYGMTEPVSYQGWLAYIQARFVFCLREILTATDNPKGGGPDRTGNEPRADARRNPEHVAPPARSEGSGSEPATETIDTIRAYPLFLRGRALSARQTAEANDSDHFREVAEIYEEIATYLERAPAACFECGGLLSGPLCLACQDLDAGAPPPAEPAIPHPLEVVRDEADKIVRRLASLDPGEGGWVNDDYVEMAQKADFIRRKIDKLIGPKPTPGELRQAAEAAARKAAWEGLTRAIQTASNDDTSLPGTEARNRHVARLAAMQNACDLLAANWHQPDPAPPADGEG